MKNPLPILQAKENPPAEQSGPFFMSACRVPGEWSMAVARENRLRGDIPMSRSLQPGVMRCHPNPLLQQNELCSHFISVSVLCIKQSVTADKSLVFRETRRWGWEVLAPTRTSETSW